MVACVPFALHLRRSCAREESVFAGVTCESETEGALLS